MIVDLVVAVSSLWQWWNNPFLVRSLRRDWRGRDVLRWLYTYTLLLGLIFGLVLVAARCIGPRGFHEHWGGSWGGLAGTLVAAVHTVLVWRASATGRWREWIAVERQAGALEMVLASPLSRAEIVLYKTTYPWALSAAVGAVGLPFYALSWALGGFSLAQIIALYAVMGALCLRPALRLAPGALAGSRKVRAALTLVGLAVGLAWVGAAGGGGAAAAALALSLPITFANVATSWLISPEPLFGIHVAPLPLVVVGVAMHWGMAMLLAATELGGWDRRYLQAVAKLRYCLGVYALVLILGWSWPSLIASGVLGAGLGCPSASALQVVALSVAGLVLLVCGLELLEKGGTLSSPLTAFGLWNRATGSAGARVGRGAAHALSSAVAVPVLTALAAALGGGPWRPGDLEWMTNVTVVCGCGLLWCYAVGLVLRLAFRTRRQAWGGACLVAALAAVAAALTTDPHRGLASPATWLSPAVPLVLLAPGTSAGVSTALTASMAQAGAALALLAVVSAVGLGSRGRRAAGMLAPPRPARATRSGGLVEWLDRRGQNPVMTLELRRSSRTGSAGAMGLVGFAGGLAAVAFALGLRPDVSALPVPVCDRTLAGIQKAMQAVAALVPLVSGLACSYAVARAANESWTSDDQSRALGAVMLTPLSSRAIAEGKLAAAALPAGIGLLASMPIALTCAVLTGSAAGPLVFVLGYAWAACTVALAGYSALWGASTHPRGQGGTGRALSCLITLHLCHWWYVSAVRGALDQVAHAPSGSVWQQAGLYLPMLAVALGLALLARRGAALGVERRKRVNPYGPADA
ncbi:MAG TPA: hypothetical protein PLD23_13190 [Armatimonadota bacterium]|nr:hypothetical protein [Armatimonadota bacterium]